MITFDEMKRVREERIDKLKKDLKEMTDNHDKIELELGTLKIQHEKVAELKEAAMKDLKDATDKMHQINKARHETEIKLAEQIEETKVINGSLKLNHEVIIRKDQEYSDLEKQCHDLRKQNESLDTKYTKIER